MNVIDLQPLRAVVVDRPCLIGVSLGDTLSKMRVPMEDHVVASELPVPPKILWVFQQSLLMSRVRLLLAFLVVSCLPRFDKLRVLRAPSSGPLTRFLPTSGIGTVSSLLGFDLITVLFVVGHFWLQNRGWGLDLGAFLMYRQSRNVDDKAGIELLADELAS
jgi:hypothetical protein